MAATPFLRRRLLDGLPTGHINGLYTRAFNAYYKKYIATNSIQPLIHVVLLYSITGYTMTHAVKHSQQSSATAPAPRTPALRRVRESHGSSLTHSICTVFFYLTEYITTRDYH